jgi:DNA-binding FadR family transcriptional regulator
MKDNHIPFSPVEETKAFLEIAHQIREQIENGNLKVGSRLPSERDLAEVFQSSRATVREALRSLEIIGIIESTVGRGTFIKTVNFAGMDGLFAEISKQTSPSEVFEARFAIEPSLASLAALRASHEDLMNIKNCLDQLIIAAEQVDIQQFEKLDGQFHYEIALASKNTFLLHVVNIINNVRSERLWGTLKERSLNPGRMKNYNTEHNNIYLALNERDTRKAEQATLIHLKTVRSNMLGT